MRSHCYDGVVPRVVNVEEQRRRIASAAWRLVAAQGLDAVSLRSAATEAGVSMGQVQHYFASKNDLLYAAVQHSYLLLEQRIESRLAATQGTPRDLVLTVLTLLLGEDEVAHDAIRVNVAFAARTQSEARIQELLTSGDEEIEGLCAQVIAEAQSLGHVREDLDPVQEARVLFALATGLGTNVALYHGSSERAHSVFRYHVERLGLALWC